VSEILLTIPLNTLDPSESSIEEVIVTDNFTIVRYYNTTITAYLRPKITGGLAIRSNSGSLTISSSFSSPVYHFIPTITSVGTFVLFVAPNNLQSSTL